MENKKVLIIEDNQAIVERLQKYYDNQDIQYDIFRIFDQAKEEIQNIIVQDKLSKYDYILMDGQLYHEYTDPLIEILLQYPDVPPMISVSGEKRHADMYQLPHAWKGFIEKDLNFILGKSDEIVRSSISESVMKGYRDQYNNRPHHITIVKELLETLELQRKEDNQVNAVKENSTEIIKEPTSFLKMLLSKFLRGKS